MKKMLSVIIAVMMMVCCFGSVSAAGIDITVTGEGTGMGEMVNGLEASVWGQMTEDGGAIEFDAAGVKGLIQVADGKVLIADLNTQEAYYVTFETLQAVLGEVMEQFVNAAGGEDQINTLMTLANSIDFEAIANLVMKYATMLSGVVTEENMTMEAGEYTLPVFDTTVDAQVLTLAPTAEDWSAVLNQIVAAAAEDPELMGVIKNVVVAVLSIENPEAMEQLTDEQLEAAVATLIAPITESSETLDMIAQTLAGVSVKVVAVGDAFAELAVTVEGQTIGVVTQAADAGVEAAVYMAAGDQVMPVATASFGADDSMVYGNVAVPMAGFSAEGAFSLDGGFPFGAINVVAADTTVSLEIAPNEAGQVTITLNVVEGESTMKIAVDVSNQVRDFDTFEGEATEITAEMLMEVIQQAMASVN